MGVEAVTCKACHVMLEKQESFLRDLKSRDLLVTAIAKCDAECGSAPSSLSSLQHLCDDHDGPLVGDAHCAIKYCTGSLPEKLKEIGLKMRYKPRWEFDVEITRLENWKLEP